MYYYYSATPESRARSHGHSKNTQSDVVHTMLSYETLYDPKHRSETGRNGTDDNPDGRITVELCAV